jgi:BASS family bile acid:Na+ symporter
MNPSIDQLELNFDPGSLLVLNVILAILMFGVALDLRVADFRRLAKDPRGPLVGLAAQFVLLPAATFALTMVLQPLPSVALGMILIASCPGGNVSNFMTYLARGNTALSVGMTAVSTLAAVVMTPLNITLWGSLNPATNALLRSIEIEPLDIFGTVLVILGVPLALGMFVGHRWPDKAAKVRKPLRIVGGLIFLSFIVIGLSKNLDFFTADLVPVFLVVVLHNASALALGYLSARAMRLPAWDARAIAIEVGIQNSGLGLVLIFNFFAGIGGMAIVAAWWGVWHIVAGLTLSQFWGSRPAPRPADPVAVAVEEF